ncbi:unnamed protein product [Symbiodinium microadriaticum]|nr:unnamed protein product [Symbiodinium microadriaticum]
MILDTYRDVFSRIYVCSPSISAAASWTPVKTYSQNNLKVDLEREKCLFDDYIPEELEAVIKRCQKRNNHNMKKSILVIVDDFADSKASSGNPPTLNQLYVEGRHNAINSITSTQKFTALRAIIRGNSRQLFFIRLRN